MAALRRADLFLGLIGTDFFVDEAEAGLVDEPAEPWDDTPDDELEDLARDGPGATDEAAEADVVVAGGADEER